MGNAKYHYPIILFGTSEHVMWYLELLYNLKLTGNDITAKLIGETTMDNTLRGEGGGLIEMSQ